MLVYFCILFCLKIIFNLFYKNNYTGLCKFQIKINDLIYITASNCVVPINDIRGVESMGYAKGEKIIRCKLAAVFRLMDLYGWTQGIYNQVSVIIFI